jgi:hypothetical protein
MLTKKLLFLTLLATTSIALSCSKKNPEPECGCNSDTELVITNARAVYEGKGIFTFPVPAASYNMSAVACDADSAWVKSASSNAPNYTISGNVKRACAPGPTVMILIPPMEITAIRKD